MILYKGKTVLESQLIFVLFLQMPLLISECACVDSRKRINMYIMQLRHKCVLVVGSIWFRHQSFYLYLWYPKNTTYRSIRTTRRKTTALKGLNYVWLYCSCLINFIGEEVGGGERIPGIVLYRELKSVQC